MFWPVRKGLTERGLEVVEGDVEVGHRRRTKDVVAEVVSGYKTAIPRVGGWLIAKQMSEELKKP
jgi:hypothetical protein